MMHVDNGAMIFAKAAPKRTAFPLMKNVVTALALTLLTCASAKAQLKLPNTAASGARLSTAASVVAPAGASSDPKHPGPAKARPSTETLHGVTLADPYRYMENLRDKDAVDWIKAQSEYAAARLQALPERAAFLDKLKASAKVQAAEQISAVIRGPNAQAGQLPQAGQLLYQRASAQGVQLLWRESAQAEPKVIVDLAALQKRTGQAHAIAYQSLSPTGTHVAVGLAQAPSDVVRLQIFDVRSGQAVGKPIDRAQLGGISWANDGQSLALNRLRAPQPNFQPADFFQRSQVVLQKLGAAQPEAKPLFGMGSPGANLAASDVPFMFFSADGKWAIGVALNPAAREQALWLAPQADVLAGKAQWKSVFTAKDGVTGWAYNKDELFALAAAKTANATPNNRVLRLDLAQGFADLSKATDTMPGVAQQVLNIAAAADALYLEIRHPRAGHSSVLMKIPYGAAPPQSVVLPHPGRFSLGNEDGGVAVDARLDGVLMHLHSWVRESGFYAVAADGSASVALPQAPAFGDNARWKATELGVESDGATVPVTVIHADGATPTQRPMMLVVQSAYGGVDAPIFNPGRMAWLEQGGSIAVVHARGSGWFGPAWHDAGKLKNQANAAKDILAAAKALVDHGHTAAGQIGIVASGPHALAAAQAAQLQPALFGAVVFAGGVFDTVRMSQVAQAAPNPVQAAHLAEFGALRNKAGLEQLLATSAYAAVPERAELPKALFLHNANDPAAPLWGSAKMAARWVLSQGEDGNNTWLLVDNSNPNNPARAINERADVYAFLWAKLSAKAP
jgi:prolyl oligopeptidase